MLEKLFLVNFKHFFQVDNFIDINDGDSNESDEKSLCSLSDLEEAEGPSFSNHVDYAPSSEGNFMIFISSM